ncbi:Nucleoporin NUP37 protein [Rutstroemia sp. NJR-2017a WRK4]|nr:Nucleoporin NUP37 protein [Rutstroemia sp. NJR-2017a WRK4]
MAVNFAQPRVFRNQQNTQLSYELSHRVHTAKVYPLPAPNGSTVILYGNENGVKIIWRGGRPFKAAQDTAAASSKVNGSKDAIISLDSDEDEAAPPPFEDNPEFEDDEAEIDPSKPFPDVLQTLDLHFGTDVLHIGLLPGSILKADSTSWRGIDALKQKIVFTAACADNLVRLVTLPLTPPSPASKNRDEFRSNFTMANAGNGKWGETVVVLSGHQKLSDGVSMTVNMEGQFALTKANQKSTAETQIIVASHSKEMTGLLLLWRIPISPSPSIEQPFQSIYMPSPAVRISFNPSLSEQHSSYLLVADTVGTCRIYNYKLVVNQSDDPDSLVAEQGTWLLSLYTGFKNTRSDPQSSQRGPHLGCERKTIVDADWVDGGGAIIALLNDGEWGVWDMDGVGPGAKKGFLGTQSIKGGSISEFNLTGWIEGALKSSSKSSGPPAASSSKFVPMTPGTRKTTDLFSNKAQPAGPIRGSISVFEVKSQSPNLPSEESVLFWLGESFTLIPSLSKYWSSNPRKGQTNTNIFNSVPGSRPIKLESVDLLGERCSGIEQYPKLPGMPNSRTEFQTEIIILGEHRFTILSGGKYTPQSRDTQPVNRLALVPRNENTDLVVAGNGDLDVVDIDRALAMMESGSDIRSSALSFGSKAKW